MCSVLFRLLGDLEQALFEALFLPGHHVNDGISGTDQHFQLVGRAVSRLAQARPVPAQPAGRAFLGGRQRTLASRCPFIPPGSGIMVLLGI